MTHPTDDELEAMAARLEASAYVRSPAHEIEAAAMLRACKGIAAALQARVLEAEACAERVEAEREAVSAALKDLAKTRDYWSGRTRTVKAERDNAIAALSEEGRKRGEVEAERDALLKALSLIAVMGYSNDPAINDEIAKQAVGQARAALNREAGT